MEPRTGNEGFLLPGPGLEMLLVTIYGYYSARRALEAIIRYIILYTVCVSHLLHATYNTAN